MKHLNQAEFVDLIESRSSLPAARAQHARECERCRAEAESLRAMRLVASSDAMPEPSPLFWDHFSARVAEQVRKEPRPVAPSAGWRMNPFATWAAAGTIAAMLIAAGLSRATLHAPAPHMPHETAAVLPVSDVDPVDDLDNDQAWAVVRAAAADLAWEDVTAAGLTAHPADIEDAALQLNAAERVELVRLLNADLKRNGA
jgi:hypothetical protein